MMQQTIEQSSGHHRVTEDLSSVGEAAVGGEDHGGLLVAGVDQLEELIACAGAHRQIADLIDNEQGDLLAPEQSARRSHDRWLHARARWRSEQASARADG